MLGRNSSIPSIVSRPTQPSSPHALASRLVVAFATLAALAAGLSLALNIATYTGTTFLSRRLQLDQWWLLHFTSVLCVALAFAIWIISRKNARSSRLARSSKVILAILAALAIVSLITCVAPLRDGAPAMRDGRFALVKRGRLVRYIEEPEYRRLQALVVRGFSGVWVFMHGGAACLLFAAAGLPRRTTNTAPTARGISERNVR
jgi:cytochrome bd-type quinol oxidase subunit 2